MKKILSIFLSATLIVTCLLSIPFMTSATTTPVGGKVLLLDTTNGITDTSWLKGNSYNRTTEDWTNGITFYDSQYSRYLIQPRSYTYEILSQVPDNEITDVNAFEWEFDIRAHSAWAKAGLLFNVDTQRSENKTVLDEFSTVSDLSNCFAVVVTGTQNRSYTTVDAYQTKYGIIKDNLRPFAVNILVPDATTGKLVPLDATEYTAEEISKVYTTYTDTESVTLAGDNGYLQLDPSKIKLKGSNAYTNVSIKLIGGKLTVTVSQDGNTVFKEFILPAASLAKAPSGDFVIANGGWYDESRGYDRAVTTDYKNMTIYSYGIADAETNLLFDTTALDADGYVWADNNNAPTGVDVEPTSTDGALKFPGGIATTQILKENGFGNNVLDETVWEFKYKPEDAANNETSFLFHVDTYRKYNAATGVYYPSYLPDGQDIGVNGNARYYIGVTLYGSDDKFRTQANAWQNALTLDWATKQIELDDGTIVPNAYQNVQEFKSTSSNYLADGETSVVKPVSYLVVKTVNDDGTPCTNIRNDVYYNIKVSKAGNAVTYAIWQDGFKAETYSVAVCTLNDEQLLRCHSGDFAIVQNTTESSGYIKDMKIYDGIDASAEDYSEYADYKTEYTFDETVGDLTDNANGKITVVDGMLNVPTDGGTIRVYGLDAKNNNLGDFILKYDLTEYSEYSGNHDRLYFRRTDENNTYRIRFRMYGGQNNANYNPGTEYGNGTTSSYGNGLLYLEKIVDGTTVVLDKVPIGNGLIRKGTMTVKISAIGDKIKVWYAGDGVVYNEPLMSVTDDSYSTGFLQYDFYGGDRYVDNIEIYDLTAKAAAEKIAATTDVNAVNCTKKADYADILALHDAQIAKFDTAIADKAEEIITALDHKLGDAVINPAAGYFTTGTSTKTCKVCNTPFATTLPIVDKALESCKEEFANGKLTITLTYSEALLNDIDKGAKLYFNYSIGEYKPDKPIEIDTSKLVESTIITLEGFNVDRLNAELTYYLTAAYDGVDTTKLADDTTRKLTVANDVELDSKTSAFVNALNADGANTVVSTDIGATESGNFDKNTITADLKEGTMVLNFVASQKLIDKLAENKAYARTNKITVIIDGVENKFEFTLDVMRKSTKINISGMSFEQLNGKVTINVEFIYADDTSKNISDTIVFEGSAAVEATKSDVATAFKNYIAK